MAHDATLILEQLGSRGIIVLTTRELRNALPYNSRSAFFAALKSLTEQETLQRVSRGVYINCLRRKNNGYLIEEIACVLRRGYFNYISLESILSEFGVISQVMMSRITVMTSGPSGEFATPYGVIEFTHTSRSLESLRARTITVDGRPLLIATKEAGVSDLRRVGRNVNMIDWDEVDSD
jgi:predicted transcriptional regulator of viral defense system